MIDKLKSFIEEEKFIARVTDGWSYYHQRRKDE